MLWSPQQDQALLDVAAWLRGGDSQVFRLFGFAGTGKTTLAKHFADDLDGTVMYMAFTGKAAYVLQQKGCVGASTIHSAIYHTKDKGRARLKELEEGLAQLYLELRGEMSQEDPVDAGRMINEHPRICEIRGMIEQERSSLSQPMFSLNLESEVRDASLVVVDEVSMVDELIGSDLLSFGTKILVLGDPAQLPPVAGSGYFTEGITPDVMLTDIHRQARENPIIAMATQVRQQEPLQLGTYGESRVVERSGIGPEDALAADQMLVGRNATRHASNRRMRALKNFEGYYPVPDDKLVCLRNNHDLGLLNGGIWMVDDVGGVEETRIYMTLTPEIGGDPLGVEAHTHHFLGEGDKLPWWERKEAEEFDYGYALTVHKAQGSQWDNVMLFDESFCFRRDKWRWLYTGLTRAAERITVVRM